jgi:L-rhamnose mutarotase
MSVRRVASVIRLRPEKEVEYRALHDHVWPGVLATLRDNGITNYSIFLRDGTLFSYLEFDGDDYEEAMRRIADDETTTEWWKLTDPCQRPVDSALDSEWWAAGEELFHLD